MPVRIIVVHDEPEFNCQIVTALTRAGYEATAFTKPADALESLAAAKPTDLQISRMDFELGKPHGLIVARIAIKANPEIEIIFTALPEFEEHTKGIGHFMPLPLRISELLKMADRLLWLAPRVAGRHQERAE
jgi:CheY-like chemotaxis protein